MRSRLRSIGEVALGDILRLSRRRVPWFILVAAVVTTIIAVVLGAQDLRERQELFDGWATEVQQSESLATIVQPSMTQAALRAVRQPSPASLWIRGQDASFAPWWDFSPAGFVEAPDEMSSADAPGAIASWDLEAVIRILLSALALWVGLESLAAERAAGTLQATLDQPIGHGTLLVGKWLGAFVILGVATTLVLAAAALTGLVVAQPTSVRAEVLALAAPGVLAVLYLLTLCAAAMLIGAMTDRLDAATLAIALVWLYAAVLGPQFVASLSHTLAPSRPRRLVELDRNRAYDGRLAAMNDSVGRLYHRLVGPGPIPLDPQIGIDGHATVAREWRAESLVTRQIVEVYDLRWLADERAQASIRSWLTFANPGSLFLEAVTEAAGTGQAFTNRWRAAVFNYQRFLNQLFFDDPPHLILRIPGDAQSGSRLMGIPIRTDYKVRDVPRFQPPSVSASDRLKDCSAPAGGLGVYLLLCLALTYVTFPRTGH